MMLTDIRLAHAGEVHRQERSEDSAAPEASMAVQTNLSEAATATAVTPSPQTGTGVQLVLGLVVLSGWLWLPLLRQLTPWQPRRQRAKEGA